MTFYDMCHMTGDVINYVNMIIKRTVFVRHIDLSCLKPQYRNKIKGKMLKSWNSKIYFVFLAKQDWVALMSQPYWVEVAWSWGWLKLRSIEVEVDWSWGWLKWGWLKLRLIEVEVDWSWGGLKLRLIEVEVDWSWG